MITIFSIAVLIELNHNGNEMKWNSISGYYKNIDLWNSLCNVYLLINNLVKKNLGVNIFVTKINSSNQYFCIIAGEPWYLHKNG